jgi:cytochrome b subunit of formate dehydrogenase
MVDQILPEAPQGEEKIPESPVPEVKAEEKQKKYVRFSLAQRIEHIIFLISFSILGFTGLPQKFADSPGGLAILNLLGGIETTRLIHHFSAAVMMVISIYHVNEVLYKVYVEHTPWTMLP